MRTRGMALSIRLRDALRLFEFLAYAKISRYICMCKH
jgi:hypothetical protein